MSSNHHHQHDDHAHITQDDVPGYFEVLEISIRELMIEKGLIGANEVRDEIELLDSRTPALGSKLVAKASLDTEFKKRLLSNGAAAALEMGITIYDDTDFTVLENTEHTHHMVVCT